MIFRSDEDAIDPNESKSIHNVLNTEQHHQILCFQGKNIFYRMLKIKHCLNMIET